jgi:hypothetical protein
MDEASDYSDDLIKDEQFFSTGGLAAKSHVNRENTLILGSSNLSYEDGRPTQRVSNRALQWHSKCYCVTSVTKTFTLKGVQTIHRLYVILLFYYIYIYKIKNIYNI